MATETASARPKCQPVEPDTRFAQTITKDAPLLKTGHNGEPDIYKIPLLQGQKSLSGTFCTYVFGGQSEMYEHHKVIMMVGATGAGKSTLINALINYILGVEWDDEFRFKMVDEQGEGQRSQAHSQTQIISSYTLGRNKNHNIPYTLTIIDTPGFGDPRGIGRDRAITGQIRDFFCSPEHHNVDHIDGICFVAQASEARLTPAQQYIFESILSLFGKDVQPNILLLVTFCDNNLPKVIDAINEANIPFNDTLFKFNNAALYVRNTKRTADDNPDEEDGIAFDRTLWRIGMRSLKNFFEYLGQLSPKSLTLTKDVLEERKRLENTAERLEPKIQIAHSKLDQLQEEQNLLEQNKQEIEANKSFEYEAEVVTCVKIPTDVGAVNCDYCSYTCHYPCRRKGKGIRHCRAMMNEYCIVCPRKCIWSAHVIQNFRIEFHVKTQKQTYADIKQRYEDATGKMLTNEQVVQKLEDDLKNTEEAVYELIVEANRCCNRLREIALKPHPIGVKEYIGLLIEREKYEAKPCWQLRVQRYEQLQEREEYISCPTSTTRLKRIWAWGKKQIGWESQ